MDRWVKAGVIATIACAVFQLWSIVNPMSHPVLNVMRFAGPIVSGILLLVSVLIFARTLRGTKVPRGIDHGQLDRFAKELSTLTRFELFAVRHLCSVEGMTGEQFYSIIETLGFPVVTRSEQDEIIKTFERIAAKTPVVVRGANSGPHWSLIPDARLYVQAIIDTHAPVFGF